METGELPIWPSFSGFSKSNSPLLSIFCLRHDYEMNNAVREANLLARRPLKEK